MKNCILQDGEVITVAAPSGGVSSGDPVLVGSIFGIAIHDADEGDDVQLQTEGVFSLTKVTLDDVSAGALVFWDNSAKKVTLTAAANKLVGAAVKAAGTSATSAEVRLNASFCAGKAANVAANATANGSDAATTQALANSLKTTVNAILTAMKASGQMTAD